MGIDAEWHVIQGSDEFFAVTKAVHNALQGADVEWTTQMEHIYLERVLDNALQLEGEWDFVVIHDPQPAAIRDYARGHGVAPDSTKWIWRCHIDLTDANPQVLEFFRPFVEQYDASVWTMPQFVPDSLRDGSRRHRAAVHRPAVGEEPRSARAVRARDREAVRRAPARPAHRAGEPLRSRGRTRSASSRRTASCKEEFPDAQLVLAGSMATDDPEGFHYWELADEARGGDPDIHLLSNIQQVGNVQINAFQRLADVVMQKSLREGFRAHRERGALEGPAR